MKDFRKITVEFGIRHQHMIVWTLQNGSAERDNRTIVKAVRTMLHAKNLDLKLWKLEFLLTYLKIRERSLIRRAFKDSLLVMMGMHRVTGFGNQQKIKLNWAEISFLKKNVVLFLLISKLEKMKRKTYKMSIIKLYRRFTKNCNPK